MPPQFGPPRATAMTDELPVSPGAPRPRCAPAADTGGDLDRVVDRADRARSTDVDHHPQLARRRSAGTHRAECQTLLSFIDVNEVARGVTGEQGAAEGWAALASGGARRAPVGRWC